MQYIFIFDLCDFSLNIMRYIIYVENISGIGMTCNSYTATKWGVIQEERALMIAALVRIAVHP